ncbi:hypothetical protein, unlikely [Trypanosoma brucei gambiense DAL972]|uniref:Uncharacterized protein n=1 Tax=Trypanosoma brucei gambiense (strain MHOM/CI/86/DAL972) TaxID=679716 RepID=C9ZTV3_TRYB9|nr:hypothetical protein, unlikely [Trypanosoma brucei gambiense DAL972]CBH12839.1 hypothetical protein, unlikely [Trypanosoma brucei gambiense DAL972]|eukprot:XP_011775118.1 hypothetical protein, unlikely [Trypanosoma brucei gambiense DAL972]
MKGEVEQQRYESKAPLRGGWLRFLRLSQGACVVSTFAVKPFIISSGLFSFSRCRSFFFFCFLRLLSSLICVSPLGSPRFIFIFRMFPLFSPLYIPLSQFPS